MFSSFPLKIRAMFNRVNHTTRKGVRRKNQPGVGTDRDSAQKQHSFSSGASGRNRFGGHTNRGKMYPLFSPDFP
jgi:hypothetical protein